MPRTSYAKTTYSLRLDGEVIKELKERAKAEQTTVGALIRRSIDSYLADRAVDEAIAEMEHRITTTICRSISQLDRHQLQTRRVADIALAQNEFLLFQLIANNLVKRQEGENTQDAHRRTHQTFLRWLPRALSSAGFVKRMIKQVIEPGFIVDETPPEQPSASSYDRSAPNAVASNEVCADYAESAILFGHPQSGDVIR